MSDYPARLASTLAQLEDGWDYLVTALRKARDGKRKVLLIGNGGSAAIASHIAVDLNKNAHLRAISLTDPSMLTCYANDYSYPDVYREQVLRFADPFDVLIAISSSGFSVNIRKAVVAAKERFAFTVTLSGFKPDNPLRELGDLNYYAPASEYGLVEISHLALLHMCAEKLYE